MSNPPAIKPIDFDLAERVVDAISTKRNIPQTRFPSDPAVPPSNVVPLDPPEQAREAGGRDLPPARPEPMRRTATRQATMVRLNIEVPDYLLDAIKDRAHVHKSTVRNVVMKALKQDGFQIPEEDLIDDARKSRRPTR